MADLQDDKNTKPFELEKKKVWEHGDYGLGKQCDRKDKPIYTNPNKVPDPCRGKGCENKQWYSKGIVIRIKGTKQIVHSE